MDQATLVAVNLPGGWRLIDALERQSFKVDAALWAKLSGEERWVLYIASPYVDEHGSSESYGLIHSILGVAPEWGIDTFTVTVFGTENSMTKAAAELVKPKVVAGSNGKRNAKPDIMRFSGGWLGKFYIDGAFIYPPWEPDLNPAF